MTVKRIKKSRAEDNVWDSTVLLIGKDILYFLKKVILQGKRKLIIFLEKHKTTTVPTTPRRFILFSDASAGKEIPDSLERDVVAKEIASTIDDSDGQINFLISGEWGIGKTSVLNLIENNLPKIRCIRFSPWKYSSSSQGSSAISRAFITVLAKALNNNTSNEELYISKQVENEKNFFNQILTLVFIVVRYIIYALVVFYTIRFIYDFLPIFFKYFPLSKTIFSLFPKDTKDRLTIISIISGILALPPLGQYFISKVKEQGQLEKINSPELFEQKFKDLINHSVRFTCIQLPLNFIGQLFYKTPLSILGKPLTDKLSETILSKLRYKKIVIFIDDLERCEDHEIKEFLSGMKTFFDHDRIYYVIAADIDKLKDSISDGEPDFLRKIIQIDWNVPYLNKAEIKQFVSSLLQTSGLTEADFNLEQIIHILQINPVPRKIKYYLRRLLFILNLRIAQNPSSERFSKEEIGFLLKIIILAESDYKSYSHFSNSLDQVPNAEEGPGILNQTYKEELEATTTSVDKRIILNKRLEKTRILLSVSPRSKDIKIPLSEMFTLVGSFEEELPDASEFLHLAGTDSNKATKFLSDSFSWDWKNVLNQLLGDISQSLESIKTEDNEKRSTEIRKQIKTFLSSIGNYNTGTESDEAQKLINSFLILLPSLNDKFPILLSENLDEEIYNLALSVNSDGFWNEIFAQPYWQDMGHFKAMLSKLTEVSLKNSSSTPLVLHKILQYLEQEFDPLFEEIRNKKLLGVTNSGSFQKDLASYFLNNSDASKANKLLDIFMGSVTISPEVEIMIIDHFLGAVDLERIHKILTNNEYSNKLSKERLSQFKQLLLDHLDLQNGFFKDIIRNIFKPNVFSQYRLWLDGFLKTFASSICSLTDNNIKKEYIEIMLNKSLIREIRENKIENIYREALEILRSNQDRRTKSSITRFEKFKFTYPKITSTGTK